MATIDVVTAITAARRAVRLYPPVHPTHRAALRELVDAVRRTLDVRPLTLNLKDGRLYEGSQPLTEDAPSARALAEIMEARRIESLTIHVGFGEADGEGLSEVLGLRPSWDLQVQEELETRGVRAATVSELEDNSMRDAEERDRRREADRALYRATLAALKHVTDALSNGMFAESAEAERAIALIIERVNEDPDAILALATMTGHGEAWRFHAVSVMLHALVLGQRMGLPDRQLLALGLAALLHDFGAESADGDQSAPGRKAGAQALGALSDADCATMIVAYEHHMGTDASGQPVRAEDYLTHPLSRIVAVVDRYDNLIRPSAASPMRRDEAAAQLLREASGGPLDPIMTRLFVQALGVFPIGATVRLTDHSVGVVRSPGADPLNPHVRLVLAHDGSELRPAGDVDLAEDARAVVEVIAENQLGIRPSDYV